MCVNEFVLVFTSGRSLEFYTPVFAEHPVWVGLGNENHLVFSVKACREAYMYLAAYYGVTEADAYEIVLGAEENTQYDPVTKIFFH